MPNVIDKKGFNMRDCFLEIFPCMPAGDWINGAIDVAFAATFAANAGTAITAAETISITYEGLSRTFTTADNGVLFTAAGFTGTLFLGSGQSVVLSASKVIVLEAATGSTAQVAANQLGIQATAFNSAGAGEITGFAALTATTANDVAFVHTFSNNTGSDGSTLVQTGDNATINTIINGLDSALTTLRTKSSTLGGNVSVLQTRLDFTKKYVDTLEGGSAKLTLADINEEGANLLALQTRQQLGIQALSFAGQAEQSILALFQ